MVWNYFCFSLVNSRRVSSFTDDFWLRRWRETNTIFEWGEMRDGYFGLSDSWHALMMADFKMCAYLRVGHTRKHYPKSFIRAWADQSPRGGTRGSPIPTPQITSLLYMWRKLILYANSYNINHLYSYTPFYFPFQIYSPPSPQHWIDGPPSGNVLY